MKLSRCLAALCRTDWAMRVCLATRVGEVERAGVGRHIWKQGNVRCTYAVVLLDSLLLLGER